LFKLAGKPESWEAGRLKAGKLESGINKRREINGR